MGLWSIIVVLSKSRLKFTQHVCKIEHFLILFYKIFLYKSIQWLRVSSLFRSYDDFKTKCSMWQLKRDSPYDYNNNNCIIRTNILSTWHFHCITTGPFLCTAIFVWSKKCVYVRFSSVDSDISYENLSENSSI